MTAIALEFREQIIEQVAHGRLLKHISADLGVKAPQISKHLATDPEYLQAREIGAAARLERAYERLEECAEGEIVDDDELGCRVLVETRGNLARAREAAWRDRPHLDYWRVG